MAGLPARARRSPSVAGAVGRFALSGLIVVVLTGAAGVAIQRDRGTSEAVEDAKRATSLAGEGIVEPVVTPELLAGDPRALARVDRVVRGRVLGAAQIVRVKLWTADGRIVYSDERRLIGSTQRLGDEERAILRTGGVDAEVSDLQRPENRFERRFDKLLEVYLPIRGRGGEPLLFEGYLRFSSVAASGHRIWLAFVPALIGALLVLELLQLPLAWSLARRLRDGQRERERLLGRALEASDRERRRIARDLHDGVVQRLAGLSYALAGAAARAGPNGTSSALHDGAVQTRQSIRELRGLLVGIYPPDLHRAGLARALSDLLGGLESDGITVALDAPEALALTPEAEALLFRVAQEALRNVVAHAGAGAVAVRVADEDGRATLVVSDDGRGFADAEGAPGHFGLRMIEDLVREAGGVLAVRSRPGPGTTVSVEVPQP